MSSSEPEGTLESDGDIQAAHEQQRDRELIASTPRVVLTVVGIVLAYATANSISRPEDFSASLPFCAGQIGVMLLIYAIPGIRYEAHAERIALAADVSFTMFLVGHLVVPSTTLRRTSEALARETRVKAALATVGRRLLSHSDRQAVLDEICRLTAETLHAHFSHVWLRDSPDGAFVAVAHVATA